MTDTRSFVAPSTDAYGSSADVGRANAEAVLRTILAEGPLPRASIAEHLGLARGTVTRVTARLLEIGLLREEEPIRPHVGRPLIPLALSGDDRAVGTVHIGPREVRVGLVGVGGEVLIERRFPTDRGVPAELAASCGRALRQVTREHLAGRRLLGVGACIAGWVNPESGMVVRFDALGWADVPIAQLLADELPWPLHFDQSIRGLALAEAMFGAARADRDFIEFWLGDVVGAAVVIDGVIRRGLSGASGLVGHMPVRDERRNCSCGRRGCLSSAVSDAAVLGDAVDEGVIGSASGMRDLVERARSGDEGASEVIRRAAVNAGRAAAVMVDLLDPSLLVVAGLVTEAPHFLPAFRASLLEESTYHVGGDRLGVVDSRFGDAAPTIAAASIVLDAFYRDPFAFHESG